MRAREYANASDVLPPRLLRQIQRHWQGLLWIPLLEDRKTRGDGQRNEQIVREHSRGISTSELAEKYSLSQERIRQIVRRLRGKGR